MLPGFSSWYVAVAAWEERASACMFLQHRTGAHILHRIMPKIQEAWHRMCGGDYIFFMWMVRWLSPALVWDTKLNYDLAWYDSKEIIV